jgi:precorrin-3B synthase
MSVVAHATLRRGACPGLSAPLATGDGLLARLMPTGTIALDAMAGLVAAAQRFGNGIVEITSRGSVQVRGLSEDSAADFADAVARLAIAAQDGVPVIVDPLAGLDPAELIDAGALAAELRAALSSKPLAARLNPKVSVAIDGGGALHLDALSADIRLRAVATPGGPRLQVTIGGDAAHAPSLGSIGLADAVDTVVSLLEQTAGLGREARARDLLRAAGTRATALPRSIAEPIGSHPLRGGTLARGIGFAFGHADAGALTALIAAARTVGATGLRTAPGRALLVIGLAPEEATAFTASAGRLSFITDPRDPRRRVIACAGAPVCASGEIAARAIAPQIAADAAPLLAAGEVIHLSGCPKGCAHQGAAAFTAIGRDGACDLLARGGPAGRCAVESLPQRLAALASQQRARHE